MSKNEKSAVIVEGFRTPFIKTGLQFNNISAEDLGSWLIRELLERTQIRPGEVEKVILANNAPNNAHIARTSALRAGLPCSVSTTTVQNTHISSIESLITAVTEIKTGLADVIIAGGVESMSQMPILLHPRMSQTIKNIIQAKSWKEKIKQGLTLRPSSIKLRFTHKEMFVDPVSGWNQIQIAEKLSEEFHISREEQDEFAFDSFQKAVSAHKGGKWKKEITSVFPPEDFNLVEKDTKMEKNLSMHDLSELYPYFDQDYGTVTSGNSSFRADGAVLFLIMSREKAHSLGYKPLAAIHSFAHSDMKNQKYGLEPVYAIENILKKEKLCIKDIDLFEIGENFAVQALACLKIFESPALTEKYINDSSVAGKIDPEKCNVNGGALALGNPVSAEDARMVLNLTKELNRQQKEWGLISTGMYSGQAGALLLKNN